MLFLKRHTAAAPLGGGAGGGIGCPDTDSAFAEQWTELAPLVYVRRERPVTGPQTLSGVLISLFYHDSSLLV